jgi:hypothetical protein
MALFVISSVHQISVGLSNEGGRGEVGHAVPM